METLIIKDTIYKNFSYHYSTNNKFQKIFKGFNITLAPINECNIKIWIKANYKDKEPPLKNQEFTKLTVNTVKKGTLDQQREI